MTDTRAAFQSEVGTWAEETFPFSTPQTCISHLRREVEELASDIGAGESPAEELADCYLLLLHLAHKTGVDLCAQATDKLRVNRAR